MSVGIDADTYEFLRDKIRKWVGKNFGSQELEDPSWNIDELASYLTSCFNDRQRAIGLLGSYCLTLWLREMSDEERAKIMDRVFTKIDRLGGSVKSITYENKTPDNPMIGERKALKAVLNIEFPINGRSVVGISRWLIRQRDGHKIFLDYEITEEGALL